MIVLTVYERSWWLLTRRWQGSQDVPVVGESGACSGVKPLVGGGSYWQSVS